MEGNDKDKGIEQRFCKIKTIEKIIKTKQQYQVKEKLDH